ncbi:multicopper oxidase family protein [Oleiharenicola lentus]|uniref:multicopper oxidase family protein n=1 Tax=Oleiharenicola lentus TaxID=2508720 RepID=UPI003F66855F
MPDQKFTRRHFLGLAGSAAIAVPVAQLIAEEKQSKLQPVSTGETKPFPPPANSTGANAYRPVITPNSATLPWKIIEGVKVFHLIAEPVVHEFAPGLVANCWGYNGRVHGPTLEAVEGDRVRIYVTNRLDAPTTVHWHGILLPSGMDGVGGVSQKPINPGETYKYEFTLKQHGTYMYHSHHDEMTQMQLGMMGMFIIHPKNPKGPLPDRDYAMMLSEWRIDVGAARPDPNEMTDFNVFTMNGRSFPGTAPLLAKTGERVRIRIGNLSTMSHHAIHLHGYYFKVVATDGGEIPEAGQWPETTVHMPTGSTRTVEFIADAPGDWVMHCHMLHHVMTQMGHDLGNLIGIDTEGLDQKIRKLIPGYMTMGQTGMGDMAEMGMANPPNSLPMVGGPGQHGYITMGGMFNLLKVRDELPADGADPGWYQSPEGTLALPAAEADMRRDGIAFVAAVAKLDARTGKLAEACDPTNPVIPADKPKPTARVRSAHSRGAAT